MLQTEKPANLGGLFLFSFPCFKMLLQSWPVVGTVVLGGNVKRVTYNPTIFPLLVAFYTF